ncbi:hypothetical protein [Paenibacillus sp. SI8]|uniref:hypothetical protein n=1 Tax=unclassified Paenibacillus TaxID=185978 RepID=UPI003465278D
MRVTRMVSRISDDAAADVGILALDLILQPLKMWNMSLKNSLNAVGDTKHVMNISMILMWVVAVGRTYLLALKFGWLLYAVYAAIILDEGIRGVLVQHRWISRKRMLKETEGSGVSTSPALQV